MSFIPLTISIYHRQSHYMNISYFYVTHCNMNMLLFHNSAPSNKQNNIHPPLHHSSPFTSWRANKSATLNALITMSTSDNAPAAPHLPALTRTQGDPIRNPVWAELTSDLFLYMLGQIQPVLRVRKERVGENGLHQCAICCDRRKGLSLTETWSVSMNCSPK